ncbi:MAG: hypothetical protein O3C17_17140 [Planctomycetota bacterium]|nr:hypothetical protein [Planctomycetota bacterium]
MAEELRGNLAFFVCRRRSEFRKQPPSVFISPTRCDRIQLHVAEILNHPSFGVLEFSHAAFRHIRPSSNVAVDECGQRAGFYSRLNEPTLRQKVVKRVVQVSQPIRYFTAHREIAAAFMQQRVDVVGEPLRRFLRDTTK